MSTTSSRNFTTLYSGSGSVVPQGAYGNANVVSLLSVGTDGGNTVSNIVATGNISTTAQISAQGNITTAGYFVGSLVGNVSGNVTAAGSNTQVQFNNNGLLGADGDFTYNNSTNALAVTGNITGGNVAGTTVTATTVLATTVSATTVNATANVAGGNITTVGQVSATGNITGGNILTPGTITATGNITAPYFIGNIVGNQAAAGTNTQVQFNNNTIFGASANFTFDNSTNALNVTGNITGGNINTGGVISSTGNIQGGNITTVGQVSATGNITGGNINTVGQVSATGNITSGNVNAVGLSLSGNVVSALNVTGNITGGNILTPGQLTASGNITGGNVSTTNLNAVTISASGNVIGGNINTVNIVSASTVLATTVSATGNITGGNITTAGQISAGGNITTLANVTAAGISTAGNVTAAYFLGNVANASGIFASRIFNGTSEANIGISGGNANITIGGVSNVVVISTTGADITGNTTSGNLISTGIIIATGNINGANLVASANLTSTQQTVIGTANTGTTGNIVVSGKNIATDMVFNPDGGNAASAALSRINIGTGWLGNITHNSQQQRLTVSDSFSRTSTSTAVRLLAADPFITLNGNVTNTGFRQQGLGAQLRIGGGAAANTTALGQAFGAPFSVAAGQFNVDVGNVSPYFLGNTSLGHATMNGGVLTINGGSNIGNAYAFVGSVVGQGSGTANITNYLGYSSSFVNANVTGNLFCFYNGNTSSLGAYGIQTVNTARGAANYYFLRNDDDVAQVKLGSLRSYNEFQYTLATSGTVNIDKTNAQVQYLAPTANVTIGDFQNFVTNANDGTNNDPQTDTVTLIIQQGSPGYNVTMPTGNSLIKYANAVSNVGTTSNSLTMISISAVRNIAANTVVYLTTVSPEFS